MKQNTNLTPREIELINVECGYNNQTILSKVSCVIKQGEITCLLGKNGSGKTTLFKTILRLIPSLDGTILYNHVDLKELGPGKLAKSISYVPQTHESPFAFSVFDVVLMGQFIHCKKLRSPKENNREVALDCIKKLGIEYLIDKQFNQLSGGERQMVLIARAMAQQTRFIAMDEPTSNLDLGNQQKVMKISQFLKKEGYGVIINTHSPDQAIQYADSVILLRNGGLHAAGKPCDVLTSSYISEIYNAEIELVEAYTKDGECRKVCLSY